MGVGDDIAVAAHDDAGTGAVGLHGVGGALVGHDSHDGGPHFGGDFLGGEDAVGVFLLIGSGAVVQGKLRSAGGGRFFSRIAGAAVQRVRGAALLVDNESGESGDGQEKDDGDNHCEDFQPGVGFCFYAAGTFGNLVVVLEIPLVFRPPGIIFLGIISLGVVPLGIGLLAAVLAAAGGKVLEPAGVLAVLIAGLLVGAAVAVPALELPVLAAVPVFPRGAAILNRPSGRGAALRFLIFKVFMIVHKEHPPLLMIALL